MTDFVPGQRWICASELHMGLGTVLAVEPRTVTIVFLASGETRIYAKQSAPLHRVVFASGDRVRSHDGRTLTIASVSEHAGLVTYSGRDEHGNPAELQEGQLDNFLQLNRPGDRLFSGQIDPDKWFELRYQTLQKRNLLAHSDLYGLIGCRTSLIPHQLYIAHEVANRYAPRVLLADEVGLGKTIEAGLAFRSLYLSGLTRRIIICPPAGLGRTDRATGTLHDRHAGRPQAFSQPPQVTVDQRPDPGVQPGEKVGIAFADGKSGTAFEQWSCKRNVDAPGVFEREHVRHRVLFEVSVCGAVDECRRGSLRTGVRPDVDPLQYALRQRSGRRVLNQRQRVISVVEIDQTFNVRSRRDACRQRQTAGRMRRAEVDMQGALGGDGQTRNCDIGFVEFDCPQ